MRGDERSLIAASSFAKVPGAGANPFSVGIIPIVPPVYRMHTFFLDIISSV